MDALVSGPTLRRASSFRIGLGALCLAFGLSPALLAAGGSTGATGPIGPVGGIVGDADGNGTFDAADLLRAIESLRRGWTRPNPLADVARPCDGVLGAGDGQRLLAALLVAPAGVPVRSRCHGLAIGDAIPAPPPRPALVTLDGQFLEVARRVPEFAGLYVEAGELRVALTDPGGTVLNQALEAIGRTFGGARFALDSARAVRASYTFAQLRVWKEAATKLLRSGLLTLVDADERRNRLRVGLRQSGDRAAVEAALARVGVPRAAVVYEVPRPFQDFLDPLTAALREKQRPLVGGLVIESDSGACTLGFLAKWYGGPRGFVTNSHCLPPMGQVGAGVVVFQDGAVLEPGQPLLLEDQIGIEAEDPPLDCDHDCRKSDSTFVGLDRDETGRLGRLAGSPHVPPPASFFGHYTVVGKGLAVCGDTVHFVGARSGEVEGEVNCTCCDAHSNSSGVDFSCQTGFEAEGGDAGDSGSPVFRPIGPGDDAELLGLLWGGADGQLAYSPMSNIENELGSLDVIAQDERPEVEIVAPADGTNLGGGAFPIAELEAEVFDFEGGGDCAGCSVHWYSGKDGVLGTTSWIDGTAGLDAVLGGGPGYRAITATAYDEASQTEWDTIVLSTGNGPPTAWIDWPPGGATLYRGVPYQLQASSFDPESFQALPCSELEWTVAGPSSAAFPTSGCFPVVTFESTGFHVLSVTGADAGHLEDTASTPISIVDAPAGSPPVVTFYSPGAHQVFDFDATVTVFATATLPGGSAPLAIEWSLLSPELSGSGSSVLLATDTIPSGGSTSIALRPSDYLDFGCGEAPMTIRVRAISPSLTVGTGGLPLGAMRPPC